MDAHEAIAESLGNYHKVAGGATPDATDSVKGKMKLYSDTGPNIDGTMTQKAITDALGSGGMLAELVIPTMLPSGVTVANITVTGNGKTWTGETDENGNTSYKVNEYGDYTLTITRGAEIKTETVKVDTAKLYVLTQQVYGLNEFTWEEIQTIINEGVASSYWDVGDTKDVVLNGKLKTREGTSGNATTRITFNNNTYKVYILGFDHNKSVESSDRSSVHFGMKNADGVDIGFSSFVMFAAYFSGGWDDSVMRSTTCTSFLNCLPSDLKSLVAETTKYSDNTGNGSDIASYVTATQDKIFLLSEWEVHGARTHANSAEKNYQAQYTYYANGNSKIRYQHSSPMDAGDWWCRSPKSNTSNSFCIVSSSGTAGSSSDGRLSFAPGFSLIAQS